MSELSSLAATIFKRAGSAQRFIVAVAGPPASGKSTRAEELVKVFPEGDAALVPMDGFHYDDAVLDALGLRQRKGAPETFDFGGFFSLLQRLKAREPNVAVPRFDRGMELSRNAAALVPAEARFIIVEGNYLLLDEDPWRSLAPLFDFTVFVDVDRAELERRLIQRWREHGRDDAAAQRWIAGNDMPNVERVQGSRRKADLVI
ncbi:nucleoside triphosphate hydrolase [Salmonella enterica subsp. enterica]|nr:nucleoside triphosphate hydrolase [Salmonella enterica subsp. enterica]